MSGIGKRFLDAGYSDPKPLIKTHGKPIIEYVINLFSPEDDYIFICNEDHIKDTDMKSVLEGLKPNSKIISIPSHKLGPVYAVMQAKEFIDDTKPSIVCYCDFNQVWDYKKFQQLVGKDDSDGAIPCYIGFHPHLKGPNKYACCKVDSENHLLEIKEKHSYTENKMDSYNSSGMYYFKSGNMLKKYFQKQLDQGETLNGEHYVSLVYNLLIEDKLKVLVTDVEKFCQWGTPEDLEEYNYWSSYFQEIFLNKSNK